MARKERGRRARRKETPKKKDEAKPQGRPHLVRQPGGASIYTFAKKEKKRQISFGRAFSLIFTVGLLTLSPLLSGVVYVLNPYQYWPNASLTAVVWYIIGFALGAVIAAVLGYVAAKKVTQE